MNNLAPFIDGSYAIAVVGLVTFGFSAWRRLAVARRRLAAAEVHKSDPAGRA
jgi:hypothetical protein